MTTEKAVFALAGIGFGEEEKVALPRLHLQHREIDAFQILRFGLQGEVLTLAVAFDVYCCLLYTSCR